MSFNNNRLMFEGFGSGKEGLAVHLQQTCFAVGGIVVVPCDA